MSGAALHGRSGDRRRGGYRPERLGAVKISGAAIGTVNDKSSDLLTVGEISADLFAAFICGRKIELGMQNVSNGMCFKKS